MDIIIWLVFFPRSFHILLVLYELVLELSFQWMSYQSGEVHCCILVWEHPFDWSLFNLRSWRCRGHYILVDITSLCKNMFSLPTIFLDIINSALQTLTRFKWNSDFSILYHVMKGFGQTVWNAWNRWISFVVGCIFWCRLEQRKKNQKRCN